MYPTPASPTPANPATVPAIALATNQTEASLANINPIPVVRSSTARTPVLDLAVRTEIVRIEANPAVINRATVPAEANLKTVPEALAAAPAVVKRG